MGIDVTSEKSTTTRTISWIAGQYAPNLISAGLLLIMAINLLTVVARKSITIDETLVIPAGYYHITEGAFQLAHEHPPLPQLLGARLTR